MGVFAAVVAKHRPRAFVFENVEGFLTGARGQYVVDLLKPLLDAGYRIHLRKVNAANYGVPQHRKRVIAVGGLGWNPAFASPTNSASGAPGSRLAGAFLPPTPTVVEALSGLPQPEVNSARPDDHVASTQRGVDARRYRLLEQGQTMRDLPEHLWHESYRRRANRRVMDGTPTERRGGAPAGLRRLRADQPSKAITAAASSEFVHPIDDRLLTLRECARLQTFPDWFEFKGTRADRATLIGNAIPPLLGRAVAVSMARDLQVEQLWLEGGSLLSFVPTHASGMSPVLREVRERVMRLDAVDELGQVSLWL